jgi:hypothetical protein
LRPTTRAALLSPIAKLWGASCCGCSSAVSMILASFRNRWLIYLATWTATAPWAGWSSRLIRPRKLIPPWPQPRSR